MQCTDKRCADFSGGICPGRRHGFCSSFSDPLLAEVEQTASRGHYPAGRMLWEECDEPPFTSVVLDGVVRLERFDLEGNRRVVGLVLPGEVIGESLGQGLRCAAAAATDVTICKLDRRRFQSLINTQPAIRHQIAMQFEIRLERLRWITWSLGALDAGERVAGFLAMATRMLPYEQRPDGTGILTLTLPRPDIADLLGTSPETISRITQRLAKEGTIRILDPKRFEILDLPALIRRGAVESLYRGLPLPPTSGDANPVIGFDGERKVG